MQRMERAVKTALKNYEKRTDEDRWSKYYTCEKEYVKHLDEWKIMAGNKMGTGELMDLTEMWNENLEYKR